MGLEGSIKLMKVTAVLGLTLFITSEVSSQSINPNSIRDACGVNTSTVSIAGCIIEGDNHNYNLTGDIDNYSGFTAIVINNANSNTLNYIGNIRATSSSYQHGINFNSSDSNTVTINGNINIEGLTSYGILATGGVYNTVTLNGDFNSAKSLSYGVFPVSEDNFTFTLNGNITTNAPDTPSIYLYSSNNANITLNGNLNSLGGTYSIRPRSIQLRNSTGSTITNLGVITTAGNISYDILVGSDSTLDTLNNRQSGLTYYGKIPTNYNAVINSTTDYGKIIFSNISGTTSFGIYNGSVLESNTTYASVINGLEESNITSEYSGNYTYDGRTWAWTLENTSANLWDLVVGECTSCLTEDTTDSIEEIRDDISTEFSHMADKAIGSFTKLNTYDCNLFDTEGKCYSIGFHHTVVNIQNNSDLSNSGAVFATGYRLNDNFRFSIFLDQQTSRKDPEGISVRTKLPMVGTNLVWNQLANHLGFQFRLANAYQVNDVTITRSGEGESEEGRGETKIEAQNYVAEVSYQFSDGSKTSYRPYFAVRRSIVKQDGYTETGVVNPLTYNAIEHKSTTIGMGMKAEYKLNNTITLNGAYGIEHDISLYGGVLQAHSSTIEGIEPIELNNAVNKTRPVVTLGSTYYITPTQTFAAQFQYQELPSVKTNAKTAYLSYTVGF
jgi:hypothetical protein